MPMNVLDPEKGLEAEIFAEENRRNNASGRFVQGVFFNLAHPEFAKCRPVSNRFQKNDRVPDWPPL